MARVDGSIRSLIQGVSQQPAKTRLPGQCTLQENCSSNPVDGLTRRPPLEYIANLGPATPTAQFYYKKLGDTLQFLTIADIEDIKVFDLSGDEKDVTIDAGAEDYLDGGPLAFATLENQTYISNRRVKVEMDSNASTDFVTVGSLVYLLGGQYARTYTVSVHWNNGTSDVTTSVSHTTPNGSDVAHGAQVATDFIANALKSALDGETTNSFNTLFSTDIKGDVLYVHWTNSATTTPFSITVTDGEGGSHIKAVNGSVAHTGLLPRYAPHGYHVAITGDGAAGEDDWYVRFDVTPTTSTPPAVGTNFGMDGLWIETHQKGEPYQLVVETMPHILEYNPDDDDFEFYTPEWLGRQVGSTDSNPDPTFVGRTIEDIAYFQGRLVFLSGPAVIMSRTNRPLDFWIESATTSTDSDAIDIESTAQGVSKMLKAIPHNRDLVIFSDGGQFIVFGRNSLTPQNSSLVLTTAFEANLNASPVSAGRNIFFAINYGNYGGVREFFTEGAEDVNDSRPITQHVLKYIEGSIGRMAATSNFDTLLVQAADPTKFFVYEYIWIDQQKAQSSWSTWTLPNPVRYMFFSESVIYIVSEVDGDFVLEKMDLDIHEEEGLTYTVFLDRKTYHEGVDLTIPVLDGIDIEDMIFVQGEGCPNPGLRIIPEEYDAITRTATFGKSMGGGTVIAGQRYTSRYKPTMPLVRDADGSAVGTGKLIISKFFLNTRATGIVETLVSSKFRPNRFLRFIGRYVGNPNSVVGEEAIVDAALIVPFRDEAENAELEVFTNSHLPMTLMDIEWVGQYTKRGTRITQGG